MLLRIAVRAIEAWLLADASRLSKFLSISRHRVPLDPDGLPDPKGALLALAAHSRSRDLREDMLPSNGSTSIQGPGYTARIIEFAQERWRPGAAAKTSASLDRCMNQLSALKRAPRGRPR